MALIHRSGYGSTPVVVCKPADLVDLGDLATDPMSRENNGVRCSGVKVQPV